MAKTVKQLKDLQIKRLSKPGAYPDGEGLYLQVRDSGAKDWFYRYEVAGKGRKRGLGSYPTISLERAREAALECRQLRKEGIDPIEHGRLQAAERKLSELKGITFKKCAETYIEAHEAGWKNEKHRYQWSQSLSSYAYPTIGDLSVQDVDVGLILNVLEPIWYDKTETATRVRQRMEAILDWARVREYRAGENPARWKGHLEKLLPAPTKVRAVVHQPAMDYKELAEFYQSLRDNSSVSALALSLIIHTGVRT